MNRMGRLERLASALAESQVECQTTASEPMGSSTAPRSLGRGPWAWRVGVSALRAMVRRVTLYLAGTFIVFINCWGWGKFRRNMLFFVCWLFEF